MLPFCLLFQYVRDQPDVICMYGTLSGMHFQSSGLNIESNFQYQPLDIICIIA